MRFQIKPFSLPGGKYMVAILSLNRLNQVTLDKVIASERRHFFHPICEHFLGGRNLSITTGFVSFREYKKAC